MKIKSINNSRLPLFLFVIAYVLFSLFTFRDYGITWDEPDWYVCGGNMLKHYLHLEVDEQAKIFSIEQASHNYIYPAFLRVLIHSVDLEKCHLFNLLFASLGFVAVFEMLFLAYKNSLTAILGPGFLFLTLRYSGDIPGNPKDMPFAVLYITTLAFIYFFRNRWKNEKSEALIVGSFIGITVCVRAVGITLLPVWVIFRFCEHFQTNKKGPVFSKILDWVKKEWLNGLLLFITSQFWMMALWPYLGSNYFGNYWNIFKASSKYTWDGPVLFMGKEVFTYDLPLSYLPVWMLITLPIFLIGFFFYSWFKRKGSEQAKGLYFLLSCAFLIQVAMYAALRPVIYNGLRHYLFLIPIFCVMATMGIIEFGRTDLNPILKKGIIGLIIINVLSISIQFFELFPFQYIYFNELTGGLPGANGKFETDYWGASLKEAAQWLAQNYQDKSYKVKTCAERQQETTYFKDNMLGSDDMKDADFEIGLNQSRDFDLTDEKRKEIIFTVSREGVPLAYVVRLK